VARHGARDPRGAIDDLGHRLFGPDITLWSPPHLLGLLGAQVNTLAAC